STNIQLDIFAKQRSIEKIIPPDIVITVRIFESRFLNGRTGKGGFIRYDLITHVIVCKIRLQILPSRGYKLSQRRTNSIGKFGFYLRISYDNILRVTIIANGDNMYKIRLVVFTDIIYTPVRLLIQPPLKTCRGHQIYIFVGIPHVFLR